MPSFLLTQQSPEGGLLQPLGTVGVSFSPLWLILKVNPAMAFLPVAVNTKALAVRVAAGHTNVKYLLVSGSDAHALVVGLVAADAR